MSDEDDRRVWHGKCDPVRRPIGYTSPTPRRHSARQQHARAHRSTLARLNICRFSAFTRLTWPSGGPVLHSCGSPATTASQSRVSPMANDFRSRTPLASAASTRSPSVGYGRRRSTPPGSRRHRRAAAAPMIPGVVHSAILCLAASTPERGAATVATETVKEDQLRRAIVEPLVGRVVDARDIGLRSVVPPTGVAERQGVRRRSAAWPWTASSPTTRRSSARSG